MVHSWEEGLLSGHLGTDFKFAICVLEVGITSALTSHNEPTISLIDVHNRNHGRERVAVRATGPPLEAHLLVLLNGSIIEFMVWVLQQDLVASCKLKLLNFEGHLADASATILEPQSVRS